MSAKYGVRTLDSYKALRIEYEGAHYHITSRGNERKAIFRDDTDWEKFLELIGRSSSLVFAYTHTC